MKDFIQAIESPEGKIAAVICWYHGDQYEEDWQKEVADLVALAPLVAQKKITDTLHRNSFEIFDALGSFPDRDEALEEAFQFIRGVWGQG